MGLIAKCDACEKTEPATMTTRGGDRFQLPSGWKYRPAGLSGHPDQGMSVHVACSEECLLQVAESGPGSGPHKLPPLPLPPPKKGDVRGKK